VCALGYYLESEGIATTGIALVRENAQAMKPPRMLWVPFPLGRPLGRPGVAAFQSRVMLRALRLLDAPTGPVLEDFPEDAPAPAPHATPACPVSFSRPEPGAGWNADLMHEIEELAPWYALSQRRRGRTTVGISGTPLREIVSRVAHLAEHAEAGEDLRWLKRALDDLKAFYQESLTAQPGEHAREVVDRVLWHETRFGALVRLLYGRYRSDARLAAFARILAPRSAVGEGTGSEPITRTTTSAGEGDDHG